MFVSNSKQNRQCVRICLDFSSLMWSDSTLNAMAIYCVCVIAAGWRPNAYYIWDREAVNCMSTASGLCQDSGSGEERHLSEGNAI